MVVVLVLVFYMKLELGREVAVGGLEVPRYLGPKLGRGRDELQLLR